MADKSTDPEPDSLEAYIQRHGAEPACVAMLGEVANLFIEGIKDVQDLVYKLDARIAALETTPSLKYCGVWEPGTTHQPGDAVTLKGSLWICKAATVGAPGVDFVGWTLAVKKGSA